MTAAIGSGQQTNEPLLVEYRVRKADRYIVTRFEKRVDRATPPGHEVRSTSIEKGTFDNPFVAFEVAYALAGQEHERLGWPPGDDRMQYPKGDPRYPEEVVGTAPDRDALIKQMTERFLGWKLPEDFQPDGGISFERDYNNGTPEGGRYRPVGTNLFHYGQARAMVVHLLEGIAIAPAVVQDQLA